MQEGRDMTILVTGASGSIGRHVVDQLLQAGARVRALTRNPTAANLPDGVEVVQGDLARPETLPSAFENVERMFLIPVPATAAEVVELAKKAGVRRVVVLSSVSAPYEEMYQPGGQYFLLVERAVEGAGVEWTHVRPVGLMLSSLFWAESIRAERVVRAPYGNAGYPHVHEADVAEVATASLLDDGHVGKRYTVTGPEAITQVEQVRAISAAIGRDIRFEELTPEQARRLWSSFMSVSDIDVELMVLEESVKKPTKVRRTFEQVTGHSGRTYAQWTADHAQDFR
ncbi:MAG: SDR family NAD(P)-dependent oxidoreductase [Pyrinomonadaceae bacterium]|nr:SDR family NAD(P)-dependent oxidoreductase [Pyrinomonadaceae bacterium]